MGDLTDISWADKTFNGWKGCAKWSAACRFCYAESGTKRWGMDLWGATKPRQIAAESTWRKPYSWNREAGRLGVTYRVFGFSWADVFESRPELVEPRKRFLGMVEQTPNLIWMLLTKRIENVLEMTPWGESGWPPNVWIGTSVEQQRFANTRVPELLRVPAAVRFVSCEPLLGAVDLTRIPVPNEQQPDLMWDALGKRYGVPGRWQAPLVRGVDWVITGGESGRHAGVRPTHPAWYRSLRDQAVVAGVAFHHKQNGEYVDPDEIDTAGMDDVVANERGVTIWPDGKTAAGAQGTCIDGSATLWRVGRKKAGRLLDGKVWAQFPDAPARERVTT
jgi:protein gp37